MKNTYRVILIGLVVLGVVYANTGPEKKIKEIEKETEKVDKKTEEADKKTEKADKKTEEAEKKTEEAEKKIEEVKYEPVDICKFPVSMEVGHYVQIKECRKRKIELKQVDCPEGREFPCYKGSDVFEVRANFPAIFNATIDKSGGDEEILREVNLYWENGVNTIQGCTGDWEELTLCLEAWGVDLWKFNVGTVEVGEITIGVKPPDDPNDTELEE